MCNEITVANPADESIAKLIENLTDEYNAFFTKESAKPEILKQIVELRASMQPIIHIHH